ncbi:MAG: 4Fe-4S dicluster domain-containing protein [Oliverpabstia sp.]
MKKLKVKKGSTCMACLACVRACSESFYKEFDPDKSCIQIVEKKSVRPMACPQCGKCAEACPEGAITQNPKGVYMINKKKCTGCGKCAEACPFGLIVKHSMKRYMQQSGHPYRAACGICAKACPMDVLEVVDE